MTDHTVKVVLIDDRQLVCVPDTVHAQPGDTIAWLSVAGKHAGSFDFVSPLPELPAGAPWPIEQTEPNQSNTFRTPRFRVGNFIGRFKYHVTLTINADSGEELNFFVDPVVETDRPVGK